MNARMLAALAAATFLTGADTTYLFRFRPELAVTVPVPTPTPEPEAEAGPVARGPDAFAFEEVVGAAASETVTSGTVRLAGMVGASPLSVPAGVKVSIGGAPFGPAPTEVPENASLALRAEAPATSDGASRVLEVRVGSVSATWRITARDERPDAFSVPEVSNARPGSTVSTLFTPAGFDAPVAVSASGGGNPSALPSSGSGALPPGGSVVVTATAPEAEGGTHEVAVRIGGTEGSWRVSSGRVSPDAFAFPQVSADPGSQASSAEIVLLGMTLPGRLGVDAGVSVSIECRLIGRYGGGNYIPTCTWR